MSKVNCNIIKDLLVLYTENLTSEESGRIIEEHFNECDECKKYAEALKTEVNISNQNNGNNKVEFDYLKKIKDKRRRLLTVIISLCTVIAGFFAAVGIKIFIIGSPVSYFGINYEKDGNINIGIGAEFNETTKELDIYGDLKGSNLRVCKVKIEEDKDIVNAYNVIIYAAPVLFSAKGEDSHFEKTIQIPSNQDFWNVYSITGQPHDTVALWNNNELVYKEVEKPMEKLQTFLTKVKGEAQENYYCDYSYFTQINSENCYVFYLTNLETKEWADYLETQEWPDYETYAVSEDLQKVYYYDTVSEQWELLS